MKGISKGDQITSFSRDLFLRCLACIYCIAFSSLFVQFHGLFGRNGLEPAEDYLSRLKLQLIEGNKVTSAIFVQYPTLLWFSSLLEPLQFDDVCDLMLLFSICLSALAVCGLCFSSLPFALLWLLYLSFYSIGQTFLSFQWDIMLLECGFLAIWLAKPWEGQLLTKTTPSSVLFLIRFLLFKLMLMAGVVKIQSECPTWLHLTALDYHFATQCLPTPLAWYAHQLPPLFQKVSVAATLFIEGPATLFILSPFRLIRHIGAFLQIFFQISIILTGNYTFFNILTIVLCLSLVNFHQEFVVESGDLLTRLSVKFYRLEDNKAVKIALWFFTTWFSILSIYHCFALDKINGIAFSLTPQQVTDILHRTLPPILSYCAVVLTLSIVWDCSCALRDCFTLRDCYVTTRMLKFWHTVFTSVMAIFVFSCSVVMFTTIDKGLDASLPSFTFQLYRETAKWHITSPYGLFRTMTGVGSYSGSPIDGRIPSVVARPEIVIEGSIDGQEWKEFHFLHKPGDPYRRPSWVAPHQPRLDWQMWFAALGSYQTAPWIIHLVDKILEGTDEVLQLIDMERNPFPTTSPTYVRALLYTYDFTRWNTSWAREIPGVDILSFPNSTLTNRTKWWTRSLKGEFIPVLSKGDTSVETFLNAYGWQRRSSKQSDQGKNECRRIVNSEDKGLQEKILCKIMLWLGAARRNRIKSIQQVIMLALSAKFLEKTLEYIKRRSQESKKLKIE